MSVAEARSAPSRPIVVELVGPPGAGKSTVFQALLSRDDKIEPRPIPRRRSYLGVRGWHVLAVLATALRHRMLSRDQGGAVRELAYLRGLPRMLEGRPAGRVIVFDQGPIFLLTRRQAIDRRSADWRARTLATWSGLLDVVVLLDAPDAVLVDRINARSKEHRIKGASVDSAVAFVAHSRAVFDEALAALYPGPTILRFDTSLRSVAEVVDETIAAVARLRPGSDLLTASEPP